MQLNKEMHVSPFHHKHRKIFKFPPHSRLSLEDASDHGHDPLLPRTNRAISEGNNVSIVLNDLLDSMISPKTRDVSRNLDKYKEMLRDAFET